DYSPRLGKARPARLRSDDRTEGGDEETTRRSALGVRRVGGVARRDSPLEAGSSPRVRRALSACDPGGLAQRSDKVHPSGPQHPRPRTRTKQEGGAAMILVTGAGGNVGSELVKRLATSRAGFRAAYNSPHKLEKAKRDGMDAVQIDFA